MYLYNSLKLFILQFSFNFYCCKNGITHYNAVLIRKYTLQMGSKFTEHPMCALQGRFAYTLKCLNSGKG